MSLRFAVLSLLAEQPLHGYQVTRSFEDLLRGTRELNIGPVNQTSQRLDRAGLVQATGDHRERGRQARGVTDAGRDTLVEWLGDPEQPTTGPARGDLHQARAARSPRIVVRTKSDCRSPQHRPAPGPRWPGRSGSMAALPGRHPRRDTAGTLERVRLDLLLNSASTSWWTGSRGRDDGAHFPRATRRFLE
jgi:DNA-binding PadR family transcriptional regulator